MRRLSLSVAALISLAIVACAAPQRTTTKVPFPNSVLPVVAKSLPSFQIRSTSANADQFEVSISLKPRDLPGLEAMAEAVSDPKSPLYGQFLTPTEIGQRYGASDRDVNTVKAFFITNGMTIFHVGANNITIAARGSKATVEAMFGVKIGNFQVIENGEVVNFRSNTTPLNVPANLVDKIQSIDGVESYTRPKRRGNTLTPPMTRTLYGISTPYASSWRGQGRTIGISSWDGFHLNDGNALITAYSLPTPAGGAMSNVSVVHVGTGSQNLTAQGEGDLDFQMILAVSPLANIVIYDGTGGNLTTVLSTELTANVSDIITESYGWGLSSSTATTCHTTHLSMTTAGITYMAASGDAGTNLASFDYPDYEPEVLQVGGTTVSTDASGNRTAEVAWSLSGGAGGGGGWATSATAAAATFNVLPSWQVGTGVPTTINKRLVPDVALHASGAAGFNNPFAYVAYAWNNSNVPAAFTFSGTSASSPTFAAGLANVQQRLYSTGGRGANVNKGRMGRIQNRIYAQNGRTDVWFDITSGNIGNLPDSTPANATAKWDFATGWGAINFDAYYKTFVEAR